MRRAAHTLKGSLAIFEAAPMVEIANRLESIAKSGEFDQANAWLDKLGSMMPRLQEELSTFLQSTESTV